MNFFFEPADEKDTIFSQPGESMMCTLLSYTKRGAWVLVTPRRLRYSQPHAPHRIFTEYSHVIWYPYY